MERIEGRTHGEGSDRDRYVERCDWTGVLICDLRGIEADDAIVWTSIADMRTHVVLGGKRGYSSASDARLTGHGFPMRREADRRIRGLAPDESAWMAAW